MVDLLRVTLPSGEGQIATRRNEIQSGLPRLVDGRSG